MKNVIFIYNPISGDAEMPAQLDHILTLYQKAGFVMTLIRTAHENSFAAVAELNHALRPEHILIAGGDGTINRFVNFMKHHNIDTPIAVLPTGTANDFAKLIGMPTNILSCVRRILSGSVESIDLGLVGDKYFVNILSCGLFTDISQKTPTLLKNTFGKVAYYFGTIGELPNFRHLDINVTSNELTYKGQCLLFTIFNGRTAGNIPLAQKSNVTDGLLDVLIIKGENAVNTIRTLFHFLLQRKGGYPDDVVYFQTNHLRIEASNATATDIDGEPAGDFPLEIRCIPNGLKIVVPKVKVAEASNNIE